MYEELVLQISPKADLDEAVTSMLAVLFSYANLKGIQVLFPRIKPKTSTPEEIAALAARILINGVLSVYHPRRENLAENTTETHI